jgi:glycosyltransferase involved in cell wall biosynthesis
MKLGIVIPAHNEERRIGPTLKEYSTFFEQIRKSKANFDYEIFIVINNTKDKTESIVKAQSKLNKRVTYVNLPKGGKGYAVLEGFKYFEKEKFDLIGFVDADMSTRPEAYFDLVENIKGYDGIIASRYLKGSVVNPRPTLARFISSRSFNFLIRAILFLPYRDTQCGAKIFRRKALENTVPKITFSKWAFDVDVIYTLRKNGFRVKEHKTVWSDKAYSKINFMSSAPMMLLAIIRLRILNSPFKRFIRIYDHLITSLIWKKK